jgi:hypothetical protein
MGVLFTSATTPPSVNYSPEEAPLEDWEVDRVEAGRDEAGGTARGDGGSPAGSPARTPGTVTFCCTVGLIGSTRAAPERAEREGSAGPGRLMPWALS